MTTVFVSGSREWTDEKRIKKEIKRIEKEYKGPWLLVHGDARGADKMTVNIVSKRDDWSVKSFPVSKKDWEKYGKSAGPRRNELMIKETEPDCAILFRLNNSKGTTHAYNSIRKVLSEKHIKLVEENDEPLIVYTDGSCSPNPGPGGWAYLIINDDMEFISSGNDPDSTNNKMELQAVIEVLQDFPEEKSFKVHSDSQYVIKCAKGEFKRKKNVEEWKEYDKVLGDRTITWVWVRGHSGDKYNEIVDREANEARMKK